MRAVTRWYGANPLHLLAMLAGFALTGYAAVRLLAGVPWGVAYWFLGSVVAHDLVLFPLYALADASAVAVWRRRPLPGTGEVSWLNHVRFPVVISGILLLVWSPLILRLPDGYAAITGLSSDPYFERWLMITGVLFAASAVGYALRLRRARHATRSTG